MKTQNFYRKFVEFSNTTGIPLTAIYRLFNTLNSVTEIDNLSISTDIGISKTSINLIQKEFFSLFRSTSNKTALSENGKRVADYLNTIVNDTAIQNVIENLKSDDFFVTRPEADRNFDQFLATRETVIERLKIINSLFDIRDKRLLFLGDDDFTSVALAKLASAKSISVADIDKRILAKINDISKKENLNITTHFYDVRESLGKELWNQFDIVFTDPPYTEEGFKLFLSRAIETLEQNAKNARIYICFGHSDLSKERYIPILESIVDSGLMIRYVFDKFNKYYGAESIGSTSSLYVCEVTTKTAPLFKGKYKGLIYTNSNNL